MEFSGILCLNCSIGNVEEAIVDRWSLKTGECYKGTGKRKMGWDWRQHHCSDVRGKCRNRRIQRFHATGL